MSETHLLPDDSGQVSLPEAPGLGVTMNLAGMKTYLVEAEVKAKGKLLYRTPDL